MNKKSPIECRPVLLPTGFTLIELITAMAVAGILLALAIPSFNETIRNNRLAAAVNNLSSAIHLARMEAIRRNQRVTLCKSNTASSCANSNGWEQGWIVFVDTGNYGTREAGEEILRSQGTPHNTLTISGNNNVADYISFVPSGQAKMASGAFQSGTLKICDDRTGNIGRELVLIGSGRLRLVRGASCP